MAQIYHSIFASIDYWNRCDSIQKVCMWIYLCRQIYRNIPRYLFFQSAGTRRVRVGFLQRLVIEPKARESMAGNTCSCSCFEANRSRLLQTHFPANHKVTEEFSKDRFRGFKDNISVLYTQTHFQRVLNCMKRL